MIIYALQIYRVGCVESLLPITIWIDNAEVLAWARSSIVSDIYSNYLVLDYDIWRVMKCLYELIIILLWWGEVDSHIGGRGYKAGVNSKGDEFDIHLNKAVD